MQTTNILRKMFQFKVHYKLRYKIIKLSFVLQLAIVLLLT